MVSIVLDRSDGQLRVTIEDDGHGFDPADKPAWKGGPSGGLGLAGRRLRSCGGLVPRGFLPFEPELGQVCPDERGEAGAGFLAGCGGASSALDTADVAAGKTKFIGACGGCHSLADAGTKGNIGPNLDDAFRGSRESGSHSTPPSIRCWASVS